MRGRKFSLLVSVIVTGMTCGAGFSLSASPVRAACSNDDRALGVSRTVEIDASAGPIFGALTRQAREPSFLKPKEVVLTFDDGPMPWVTKSILDTLDTFCAKATFFSVGRMALAYPATVREVIARGHTLGTHTYSHPFNMPRMKAEAATSEIERGFAAVATAAGQPIAPFFRFTGLSDSSRLMAYLQTRGIAAFTVDVVSNDSYINDPVKLADRTVAEIVSAKGGIVLFHDIKTSTAKALPVILSRLKAQGYSIVHIVPKRPVEPMADAMRDVAPKLARVRNGEPGGKTLLPFYGAIGPDGPPPGAVSASANAMGEAPAQGALEVTSVVPLPRIRATETAAKTAAAATAVTGKRKIAVGAASSNPSPWLKQSVVEMSGPPVVNRDHTAVNGWVTEVVPPSKLKPVKPAR